MKRLLLIAATLLFVSASYGQDWYGGPMISGNLASLTGLQDTKLKFGGQFGGFGGYDFNDWIGIEARIFYSFEGTAVDYEGENTIAEISYIKLPIFAKFTVAKHLYFVVGPDMKYKITDNNWRYGAEFTGFNIGAEAGVGYQFDFGLRIEAGYSYMFTKCLTAYNVPGTSYDFVDNHQQAITLGVAWRF